ncbi:hypothetical protein KUTeg_019721 [Tegillarca granosa]|uniref:SAM domain-containing protein n=1 Tax=Tegillarca granosa TaxID=220873 RepID=A0ABQ9EII6_TEGGR|nr:hypothetical protein KUTeg_019721 [Tegillarca granosa]
MSVKRKYSGDSSLQNGGPMVKIPFLTYHDLTLSQETELSQSQNMDTCRFPDVEDVADVLIKNDMSDVAAIFTDENIDGSILHMLTEEHLQNMGIQVCYLAGQLARALQRRQPELKITEKDILCVEIAGLCHDLEASVKMFDYLLEDNGLVDKFQKYGLTETDRTFIKEQIVGPVSQRNAEIVANKRNGIDVDKWDYFARDCHMLGIRNNFDHTRFMKFARVLEIEGDLQICSRDKEVGNLYDMFHTRMTLHRRAYQHQVNNIIETMITEALMKADNYIRIPGKNGTLLKMSETIDDMEAYTKLNDNIIHQILMSTDTNLKESQQILWNVLRRRLYKCVGQARSVEGKTIQKTEVQHLNKEILDCKNDENHPLEADDLIVHLVYLDYGMKQKNPIDHVRFYNKKDPSKAIRVRKDEVSQMLPEKFAEQHVRLYCKKTDPHSLEFAAKCFQLWCEQKGFPRPKVGF